MRVKKDKVIPITNNNISIIKDISKELDIVTLLKTIDNTITYTELDNPAYSIIYYLSQSIPLHIILKELNITPIQFELIKHTNPTVLLCLSKIYDVNNNILKDKTLSSFDNASDNIKMFIVKSQFPEFRDNFLPQVQGISTITINLDGIGSLDVHAGRLADKNPIDITNDNIKEQ